MMNPYSGLAGQNFVTVQQLLRNKLTEYQQFPQRLTPKDLKDLSDAVGHNWMRELSPPPPPPTPRLNRIA